MAPRPCLLQCPGKSAIFTVHPLPRKMRKIALLLLALLASIFHTLGQDFSNKGKEFWIGYGHHVRMVNSTPWPGTACVTLNGRPVCPETMELYITSDESTTGKVEIPGIGFTQNFTVNANQITTIEIPRAAALPDEGTFGSGIHVTAEKAVVVYSFIYVNSISGATLCLPVSTLGREYMSINFDQVANEPNTYSYFFVIATDPGVTKVEITPTKTTKGGRPANTPYTIDLNQGQVHQVLSALDLTGSTIRSLNTGSGCKRIAVFSGSSKITIGCVGNGTADNLYQQAYPTSTWGKTYLFTPSINSFQLNGQYNFIRVIRSDTTANFRYNGAVYPAGNARFVTLPITNQPGIIESDKPIMVAQYFTTQGCGGNLGSGDPDMIFLNPVEQTINKVTLNAMQPATNTNLDEHYINVTMRDDPRAYGSFVIDGVNRSSSFRPIPNAPGYAYARIPVSRGTHNLTCDTPFNAIAYGFGQNESYGYSAGTNLKDLYQFVSIKNVYGTVSFPAGCKASPLQFSMTFPYQPTSIAWKFNGLFSDTTITTPVPDSSWIVNGRTIWRYDLKRYYQANDIGTYPIKVVANNPLADGCSGEQEIDYDLRIFAQPSAAFDAQYSGCIPDSLRLFDRSGAVNDRPIIMRSWDFGNGTTSSIPDPVVKYASAGNYTVRYKVVTDIGCISSENIREIKVSNLPVADFSITGPYCEKGLVQLGDASLDMGTPIAKWYRNYGDGVTDSSTAAASVTHVYDTKGRYAVSLVVKNTVGCMSDTLKKIIDIHAKPVAGFGLPEICLNDAFAQFTDSSSVSDGSALSYQWDFGDGQSGTGNTPRHRYAAAGNYQVTQWLTSDQNCRDTLTRSFTVNGAVPISAFEALGGTLCSNRLVSIKNNSTVDFGNVTRLTIQWDMSDPASVEIDEEPSPGKTYAHRYTSFQQPATKPVNMLVTAYSGGVCSATSQRMVVLQGSPKPQFGPIDAVCDNVEPFVLTSGSDASGLLVSTRYVGAGMRNDSLFAPHDAGSGTHDLLFISTTNAGCVDTARGTVRVNHTPNVDAGPDLVVLEGTAVTIAAQADNDAVTFQWTPAEGLNDPKVLRPAASPSRDMIYTVRASSAEGCTGTDELAVHFLPKLIVPNTFTPNGDGYNDRWEIKGLELYTGCVIEVFTDAGALVFRSQGYGQPWDGRYQGRPLPAGTYYYVIDPKNGRPRIAGYVTILK